MPDGPSGRVLVVDDEPMLCVSIQRMLSRDHEVATATSAREALDLIASGQRYDVILCDLMMPGMSGIDLHAALAASAPEQAARMVFMTGGAFTPAARAFLDRNDNASIDKPFVPANLRQFVHERLRREN